MCVLNSLSNTVRIRSSDVGWGDCNNANAVLPNPAGAPTSVRPCCIPICICANRRCRGTRSERIAGRVIFERKKKCVVPIAMDKVYLIQEQPVFCVCFGKAHAKYGLFFLLLLYPSHTQLHPTALHINL